MITTALLAMALVVSSAFAAPIEPTTSGPVNNYADALTKAVREAIIKTRSLETRSAELAPNVFNTLTHREPEVESRSPDALKHEVGLGLDARSNLGDLELIPPPDSNGVERVHPREPGPADEAGHELHELHALPNLPPRDLEARTPEFTDEVGDGLDAIGHHKLDLEARSPGPADELRNEAHAFPNLPRRDLDLEARSDIHIDGYS